MNKITLIIPDLHHRVDQADKIIKHVGADEVIFIGDAFDDFDDTPEMVRHTCEWVENFINTPNHIFIGGNHDIQYMYPYKSFQCSGYAQWKYFIVRDTINPKLWDKVKWFHFLDDKWLLCHAGLHNLNVPDEVKKHRKNRPKFITELTSYLDAEIVKGFQNGAIGTGSWVFNAGRARWGMQRVGGLTWCDFNQEFFPVRGINQIIGHTPQMQGPRWCLWEKDPQKPQGRVAYRPTDLWTPSVETLNNPDQSQNICLDVHGNIHYAVWDGKNLVFGNYRDL